jgi:ABC-type bacteriocin/lantibiotic exporter with double-glycine peptidase domain
LDSKIIAIICAWGFLIVLWILSYFGQWDLFWPLILSFIVLVLTVTLSYTPEETSSDEKLSEEIKDIKSKLETTAKDVEEIKKIIEE